MTKNSPLITRICLLWGHQPSDCKNSFSFQNFITSDLSFALDIAGLSLNALILSSTVVFSPAFDFLLIPFYFIHQHFIFWWLLIKLVISHYCVFYLPLTFSQELNCGEILCVYKILPPEYDHIIDPKVKYVQYFHVPLLSSYLITLLSAQVLMSISFIYPLLYHIQFLSISTINFNSILLIFTNTALDIKYL